MGKFFKPWRRKTGCVTLAFALMAVGTWMRSYRTIDRVLLPSSSCTTHEIHSDPRGLYWEVTHAPCAQIKYIPFSWESWRFASSESFEIDLLRLKWNLKFAGCGIGRTEFTRMPSGRREFVACQITVFVAPYWAITLALTIVSALLILIKPKTKSSRANANTMNSTSALHTRRGRFAVAAAILAVVSISLLVTSSPSHHSDSSSDVRQLSNSKLIDSLAKLNGFGVGFSVHDDTGIFLATDSPRKFDQDESIQLSEFPEPLVELVRRGAAALPDLCEHLDDQRTTTIGVRTGWSPEERQDDRTDRNRVWLAAHISVGSEYDARHGSGLTKLPPASQRIHDYWVTVGDLCYVAIGQIVNREFRAIQYGGSNCGSIMSPGLRPDLLRIVRAEWCHLTAEDHRHSLEQDALTSRRDHFGLKNQRTIGAVKRLCFYYPQAAEQVLHGLLSRRVYNQSNALDFVLDELGENRDLGSASMLLEQYRARYGETEAIGAVEIISEQLAKLRESIANIEAEIRFGESVSVNGIAFERSHESYEEREYLSQLLEHFLPLIGGASALDTVASPQEQIALLDATLEFPSKKVDAVLNILIDPAHDLDVYSSRDLIDACERRRAKQEGR